MKKILFAAFLFLSLICSPKPARSDEFDKGQEAAAYLGEYQAEQARNGLMLRGLLGVVVAVGLIALVVKNKKKNDGNPPPC